MLPHPGFVIFLTLPYVSMGATASVKLLNDCSTFEQMKRRYTETGFSSGSSHRVPCVQCALFVCLCLVFHLLSALLFCFLWIITISTSDGLSTLIHVYRIEYRRLLRAQYVESSIGIALPTSRTSIWPRSHSLVTSFLIYSVTRRKCSSVHDDSLGTTVHGIPFFWCGTVATLVTSTCCRTKQGFRNRLPAEKVFVRRWEMVSKVHRLMEIGLAISLFTAIEVAGLVEATFAGLMEVTFHAQAIVECHVPCIYLPHRARGYQLEHRP